ncbi:MAG: hypothetical protein OEU54_07620 [Gemmatimonadota bacterium]|nr:hypothetical protein [Gemmatimonadota bacterium]
MNEADPSRPERAARDEELEASGWLRRFTGSPPRLQEIRELYEGLGWEVHLDELSEDELPEGCGDCTLALSLFRVVYTRRPSEDGQRSEGTR